MTKPIAQMTTTEVVAEYNLLTDKNIKKFSSRAAGEQQLAKAREFMKVAKAVVAAGGVKDEERKGGDRRDGDRRTHATKVVVQTAEQPEVNEVTEETQGFHYDVDGCPNCHATEDQTYAGEEGTTAEERNFCHHCGTEYWRDTGEIYKAPAKSDTRSKAIAATWENDQIAAARSARDNVAVDGVGTFRSVAAAFKQLGLPMSKHIKFRIEVKANGSGVFKYGTDEYEFRIVNKQDELPV
ncbi:MAG: hypothetical protein E6Q97_19680 [Desulfurellales bacterium]|nr:MAG: hypothetical protein E6Q97_19680 [Desulfurellales bacterium]